MLLLIKKNLCIMWWTSQNYATFVYNNFDNV